MTDINSQAAMTN